MPRPMPSPRGTNYEGLTMPGPVAAYDAALSDDTTKRLTDFLADKITPEDMDAVRQIVSEDDEPDNTMAGDAATHRARVRDQYRRGLINAQEHDRMLLEPARRVSTAADHARLSTLFPNMGRLKG